MLYDAVYEIWGDIYSGYYFFKKSTLFFSTFTEPSSARLIFVCEVFNSFQLCAFVKHWLVDISSSKVVSAVVCKLPVN